MAGVVTFGPAWSRALCLGCSRLSALGHPVPPEWILAMIALESAGTWSPDVLQGKATLVPSTGPKDMRPEVQGRGGLRLSHGTGARGLFQVMPARMKREGQPDLLVLYAALDPLEQLADGVRSWADQAIGGHFGGFKSREALYCANLAPARLIGGEYDDETIIYSAHPDDKPLNDRKGRFTKTYWPEAYLLNGPAFGIDVKKEPKGRFRMYHLAVGLNRAVGGSRKRYEAELTAAYIANAGGPPPLPPLVA